MGYGSGIVTAVALVRSLAPGLPCSLAMAKKNTEECLAHGISLSILCLILQIRSRSRERRLEKAQGGGPAPRNQFSAHCQHHYADIGGRQSRQVSSFSFFGRVLSMQNFQGQRSNMHHNSDPNHSGDNARSLTG